jgi:hypothetical protein
MAKTKQEIDQSLDRLISKNPHLNQVKVLPLNQSGLSYNQISEFIESSWRIDYGDETRMTFTPSFLEYNMDNPNAENISIAAFQGSQLAGIVLGFEQNFAFNKIIKGCICTGFSVLPELRGKRIAQLLSLKQMDLIIDNGYNFLIYWLDTRHTWEGSSFKIFSKKFEYLADYPMYAKSFDYEKTIQINQLKAYEKGWIKLIQKIFPSRDNLPVGFGIDVYSTQDEKECFEFINEFSSRKKMTRYFSENEFDRKMSFKKSDLNSIALILHQNNKIFGLIYGFTNPVQHKDSFFQYDGMIFHPDLTWSVKRKFISAVENYIIRELGCFSAVLPGSITDEQMVKYGYFPVISQALAVNCFTQIDGIKNPAKQIHVELR